MKLLIIQSSPIISITVHGNTRVFWIIKLIHVKLVTNYSYILSPFWEMKRKSQYCSQST